ncbi:MAG: serine/threonine-protein phosphatase [Oscillospiraceae bacterium]|nr:serine/threonine-protein phosphatase [Oscillospiraceae bacterium]
MPIIPAISIESETTTSETTATSETSVTETTSGTTSETTTVSEITEENESETVESETTSAPESGSEEETVSEYTSVTVRERRGDEEDFTESTGGGFSVWWLIAGIVLGVVIGIAAVILSRRKSAKVAAILPGVVPVAAAVAEIPQTAEIRSTVPIPPVPVSSGYKIANIQGQGRRNYQQDCFAVTDINDFQKGVLAVVADGMGGVSDGDVISRICVQTSLNVFATVQGGGYFPSELLGRITADSQREARSFIVSKGYEYSGSTLICAILRNNELYFTSVGDSMVALLRNGSLVQLNREHTHKVTLDERAARGEITFEEARNAHDREALTSYIGIDGELQRDCNVSPIALQAGDRVLLMSDGIFGTVDTAEIARLASNPDIYEAGRTLENAVLSMNKPNQDNFTAIILEN